MFQRLLLVALVVSALTSGLTGCVTIRTYNDLMNQYDNLSRKVDRLDEAVSRQELKSQELQAQIDAATKELDELSDDAKRHAETINDLNGQIERLLESPLEPDETKETRAEKIGRLKTQRNNLQIQVSTLKDAEGKIRAALSRAQKKKKTQYTSNDE